MNAVTASRPTRRDLLALGTGAVLGAGVWEGLRHLQGTPQTFAQVPPPVVPPAPPLKAIIDVHTHLVGTNLPGVPRKNLPGGGAFPEDLEAIARALQAEMKASGVTHLLAMPQRELNAEDPLGISAVRKIAARVPGVHPIGFADPERFDEKHLARVDEELSKGDVKGLKAFLGYLHFGPSEAGYRPYYKLAAKHGIPIIFHTGDTFSQQAKLKFAHPLLVDEVAVDFPDTRFVIAHMGNPWLMDAAQVVYKNNKKGRRENVYVDLSGLLIGSAETFTAYRRDGVLASVGADVRKAIEYAERPEAFLYGSDWPLAPMPAYRDFIRGILPAEYHPAIFHDNAKALFKLP